MGTGPSIYREFSNILQNLYPESADEHQSTLDTIAHLLSQKANKKLVSALDPSAILPDSLQIWFPIYYKQSRIGIQFDGANTTSIFIQQSLEPNGDFNSQIRIAEIRVPIPLNMTFLCLGLAGFLAYMIKTSMEEQRENLMLDIETKAQKIKEQGNPSFTSFTVD